MRLSSRSGVTLIELLIFVAIFAGIAVVFMTVLVSVSRVNSRQSAAFEVNQQSNFLLQTFQRYIEQSSAVEIVADTPTSTLKLRMTSASDDPSYLFLSNGVVYLRRTDAGALEPLTTDKVQVTDLTFTKRANTLGHDAVSIIFTMAFNTGNPTKQFRQGLQFGVGRVSAATFDSNVVPSTGGTYKLGVSAGDWGSINNTIFFNGANVGIGALSPNQTLEVDGGLRLNTTTAKPTCDATQRGTFWVRQMGTSATDTVEACLKDANEAYSWVPLD